MTLEPRKLTEENAHEIKEYLQYSHKYMSLAKFQTLFLWRDFTGLTYDIKDGFLYMFECQFENTAIMPFGKGDLEKAINTLEEYCMKVTESPRLYCVSKEQKKQLIELFPGKYIYKEMHGFGEYVYLQENLANLTGKKFSKKRNHINKFDRQYEGNFEYVKIDSSDSAELERVMDVWCEKQDCGPDKTSSHEKNAILELLNGKGDIDYRGGAIRINGRIEAFALGSQIADDMAVVIFEKADTEFDGIYAKLNQLYSANEWSDVKYINRQEDMDKPGLRKSKSSYYPEFIVENFVVRKKRESHI